MISDVDLEYELDLWGVWLHVQNCNGLGVSPPPVNRLAGGRAPELDIEHIERAEQVDCVVAKIAMHDYLMAQTLRLRYRDRDEKSKDIADKLGVSRRWFYTKLNRGKAFVKIAL